MMNVVAIMGRLAADPVMRQTTTGKPVASFRIACDRGRKDANGNSTADWIDVVAWNQTAEFVCRYFKKGNLIAVDGRLQSRQYQDNAGNNRTAIEVVANNVNFCQSKNDSASAPQPQQKKSSAPAEFAQGEPEDFELIDDDGDIPF